MLKDGRRLARCSCGGLLEILLVDGGRGGFLLRCEVCDTVAGWAALYRPPELPRGKSGRFLRWLRRQIADDDPDRHRW